MSVSKPRADASLPAEVRQGGRVRVHIIATCRHALHRFPASLVNLSRNGCCVRMATRGVEQGQDVTVMPDGMDGFRGTIKWVNDEEAGIHFDRDLYAPIFDHLVRLHSIPEA